jgi:hypothetical protein
MKSRLVEIRFSVNQLVNYFDHVDRSAYCALFFRRLPRMLSYSPSMDLLRNCVHCPASSYVSTSYVSKPSTCAPFAQYDPQLLQLYISDSLLADLGRQQLTFIMSMSSLKPSIVPSRSPFKLL